MKIIKFIMTFCLFLILLGSLTNCPHAQEAKPEICMYIFYGRDCEDCQPIINEFLPQILAECQERVSIRYFEVSDLKNYEALVKFGEVYNKEDNEFPIIIVGRYLLGHREIEAELEKILDEYSKSGVSFQRPQLIKDAQYTETPLWEGQIEKEADVIKPEVPKVYLAYFYEFSCKECDRAEYQIKYLQWKYQNLVVKKFDIADAETKKLAEALGELYSVPEVKRMATPSVFIGQDYLVTRGVTDKNLMELIEKYKYKGTTPPWEKAEGHLEKAEKSIINRFKGLEITAVFLAGLVDGVNPCAFVTIIFFLSYAAFVGRKGRTLLLVGSAFTVAVLITYFLVGLGLLKFLQSLSFMPILARIVYMLTAGGAVVLGCLCIYDYTKYREEDYDASLLKLPNFLHKKIHQVVREGVRMRNYLVAAFVTGFFIAILEFACTGQVYLPTIIFVTRVPSLKAKAISYLAVYNFCFILPLVFIFLLAYKGMTSERLSVFWRKKGKAVKLLMAFVFFCLAGFLIFYIV